MDAEKLYMDYFSVVYRYILSISKDPLTAEEITQETFFKALKNIDSLRSDESAKAWLCKIAKNEYLDFARRRARSASLSADSKTNAAAAASSPEDEFISGLDAKAAHRALHGLSEPYKEVFTLRTFGDMSFSDIGELFGKTDSWARVTFHRARLMIMEELKNGGYIV